jgi:uncharacterized protein
MSVTPDVLDVPTPVGVARVHRHEAGRSSALLVLGHGAGGGLEALDLVAARDAALALGMGVALVEQPWRVAGRRIAEAAPRLDAAWTAAVGALGHTGSLVLGGRSSGARVACRTSSDLGAVAVVALAFPLTPPGTGRSRLPELQRPQVPRLVVQGARDPFGLPVAGNGVAVHVVQGADHGFTVRRRDGREPADVAWEVRAVVQDWLAGVLAASG